MEDRLENQKRRLFALLSDWGLKIHWKLIHYIGKFGRDDESYNGNHKCLCAVSDALFWVLGEMTTEGFKGKGYLNLDKLRAIQRV